MSMTDEGATPFEQGSSRSLESGGHLVVAGTFTSVHEAQLARSVLEAAGIEAVLADEHLISMNWTYSNAIGGVKILVTQDRLQEAQLLLGSDAEVTDEHATSNVDTTIDRALADRCRHCGSESCESSLPGKRMAILSWLTIGIPLGIPSRRRYCRNCGAPATDSGSLA
jgi:hypothetical protein